MQIPSIDYCLICDDLRLETLNKATILGFYGVLPRVRIILQEWGKAIDRITFLVSTHGITEPYTAQLRIVNPDGTTLAESNLVTAQPVTDNVSNSAIGFAFPLLTFRQQGEHRVEVSIDNTKAYDSTFIAESARLAVKS